MEDIARREPTDAHLVNASAPAHASGAAPVRRRALVVDDDDFARHVLVAILRRHGFQVVTATDGLAGLRALVDDVLDLDVVVTDVRMPGMNGEELVSRIREAGGERDVGIVVVSAYVPDEARLRAMGVDAVIGKADGVDAIAEAVIASARAARARAHGTIEEA